MREEEKKEAWYDRRWKTKALDMGLINYNEVICDERADKIVVGTLVDLTMVSLVQSF